jgi:membrane protein
MRFLKWAILAGKSIYLGFERKHLALVAAGLAYYFLMALFPALMLLTAIVAYLPLQNGAQGATSFMAHIIPQQNIVLIEQTLATISPYRTGLLSVGAIASLWINRILAFGLTVGVGVLLLLAVALTLAGPILETILSAVVPLQSLWIKAWPYIQWLLAGAFIFAAIELLYVLAPNVPAARRVTIPGALVAAAAWLALSKGLGIYFQHFGDLKLNAVYGILATPIALVIWLHWSSMVILIGAEINVTLQSHKKLRVHEAAKQSQTLKDAA